MCLKELFPLEFGYEFEDFRMLMRSILIKSLYDGKIKRLSRYKGMHKSGCFNECWTMKFGFLDGIYGLVLSDVKDKEAGFSLYYFPTPEESLSDGSSLFEALIASRGDYLSNLRDFSSRKELFCNFIIAKIYLKAEDRGLFLSFQAKLRDRSFAKDGVTVEGKEIIKKGGADKDFRSFKHSLAFMNFLHLALSKIYAPDFGRFKIYKKNGVAISYDRAQNLENKKDIFSSELYINMLYGESKSEYVFHKEGFKLLPNDAAIAKFLIKLEKDGKNKEALKFKDRANFFIITGFLGSGKTKFLQNFIERETAQNRFTGVIQNEIGKIGLDGRLLDAKYATVEIDEGCVCCSLAGQIKVAVSELSAKNPDTILLETTGVANPFNLLSELNEIKESVNLCSVVTVVDGANFLNEYERSKILLEQVKAADAIVLNKIDLISQEQKERIRQILSQNNRCAEIFETINAELNPNFLLYNHSDTSYIASVLIDGKMRATHQKEGIVSFKKDIKDGIDRAEFESYIKSLPENFYRIKGLVCFKGDPVQYVFQFVGGKFDITPFDRQKRYDSFLVFIGRNIDESFYFPQNFL